MVLSTDLESIENCQASAWLVDLNVYFFRIIEKTRTAFTYVYLFENITMSGRSVNKTPIGNGRTSPTNQDMLQVCW
jgi:hypothetical protein